MSEMPVSARHNNQQLLSDYYLDRKLPERAWSEIAKVFKRDIPARERGDWEMWLEALRVEHERRTGEIKTIEESTKYRYGEISPLDRRWARGLRSVLNANVPPPRRGRDC